MYHTEKLIKLQTTKQRKRRKCTHCVEKIEISKKKSIDRLKKMSAHACYTCVDPFFRMTIANLEIDKTQSLSFFLRIIISTSLESRWNGKRFNRIIYFRLTISVGSFIAQKSPRQWLSFWIKAKLPRPIVLHSNVNAFGNRALCVAVFYRCVVNNVFYVTCVIWRQSIQYKRARSTCTMSKQSCKIRFNVCTWRHTIRMASKRLHWLKCIWKSSELH